VDELTTTKEKAASPWQGEAAQQTNQTVPVGLGECFAGQHRDGSGAYD